MLRDKHDWSQQLFDVMTEELDLKDKGLVFFSLYKLLKKQKQIVSFVPRSKEISNFKSAKLTSKFNEGFAQKVS